MDDSRNQPEIETLSYVPHSHPKNKSCATTDCYCQKEFEHTIPASAPRETLGSNSHVIKPETRVNKTEDAGQHLQEALCRESELEQPKKLKQNARFAARSMMIAEIVHSKKIPEVCKNLMIENVQSHMQALGNALGCIELAARRAIVHGI